MKSLSTMLAGAAIFLAAAVSCKKENASSSPATLDKLLGRWRFTSGTFIVYNHISGSVLSLTPVTVSPGDYAEFLNNGQLFTQLSGTPDTLRYQLLDGNRLITIDGLSRDTVDITGLTATDLTVQSSEVNFSVSPPQRLEITYNFKK